MEILYQRNGFQYIVENNGKYFLVNTKNNKVTMPKSEVDSAYIYLKLGYWEKAKFTEEDKKKIESLIKEAEQSGN